MLTFKEYVQHDSTYQLDEGLGSWIEKKMDQLLDNPKPGSGYYWEKEKWNERLEKIFANAPKNATPEEGKRMVDEFLKKAELKQMAKKAAASQKTTLEKIKSVLGGFVAKFIKKWKEIPEHNRREAWKNFAMSIVRLLMFILKAMSKK